VVRFFLCVIAIALGAATVSRADWFGSGENAFELPFVTVGEPGNPADLPPPPTLGDPNPTGVVGYEYRIGKYEVPEEAVRKANAASALAGTPLGITLDSRGPQKPATSLSWIEAARFVNWLNADKGAAPAYKFSANGQFQLWTSADTGFNPSNPFRNQLAQYFLPSADEWYKAAFYDPQFDLYWDYPTGSNDPPTPVASGTAPGTAVYNQSGPADVQLAGGASPFGAVGMAGNIYELEETAEGLVNTHPNNRRGVRNGAWLFTDPALEFSASLRNSTFLVAESLYVGIRIASVPEPGCLAVLVTALAMRFRRREFCRH
jgi:formylglycine-generating enzyme required for sulfatase activity